MKPLIFLIISFITLISCKRDLVKDGILMAEREAPIGFNHLRVFKDSTFEFEYTNFPNNKMYKGKMNVINDTLYFDYTDSTPIFGNKAIIKKNLLIYNYGESKLTLEIWLDSISK